MALPQDTTRSLRPAFATAPHVRVTVKQVSTFTLYKWFPTILNLPLRASVTLLEATTPVKLPTIHCPTPGFTGFMVRCQRTKEWYFKVVSMVTSVATSKTPTYPTHQFSNTNIKLQLRCTGSIRLTAGTPHFHGEFNFTGMMLETAEQSLRHSCASELTWQGISLP